jgi:hypothetical protein
MTAYLIPTAGYKWEVRPLLILTNGYDATITDIYFASAIGAASRLRTGPPAGRVPPPSREADFHGL